MASDAEQRRIDATRAAMEGCVAIFRVEVLVGLGGLGFRIQGLQEERGESEETIKEDYIGIIRRIRPTRETRSFRSPWHVVGDDDCKTNVKSPSSTLK